LTKKIKTVNNIKERTYAKIRLKRYFDSELNESFGLPLYNDGEKWDEKWSGV
jgi:hypothetical protein